MSQPHFQHPGLYVRNTILTPKNISIAQAARMIGMSRVNFSNFINGKVSATPATAAKLEHVFGVDAKRLLEMQSIFDSKKISLSSLDLTQYSSPCLATIKARHIETFFKDDSTHRSLLAVFLRTLIRSTCANLEKFDFPGYDDAERPGWDGILQTDDKSPWIPSGKSAWEFGVNKDFKTKANQDFHKRTDRIDASEQARTTFVFVTPHKWQDKDVWAQKRKAQTKWKDVRVLDSHDLEQWIECAPAAQIWFCEASDKPLSGVRSLQKCWNEWSLVTKPPLPLECFDSACDRWTGQLKEFIRSDKPSSLSIRADSSIEALAFLHTAFTKIGDPALLDKTFVFDSKEPFEKLASGPCDFIAVLHTAEVENSCAPFADHLRIILINQNCRPDQSADISLSPLDFASFRRCLETMQKTSGEISRLARESGRSLTILRRRLASSIAIQIPVWAGNSETTEALLPFVLAGSWDTSSAGDISVLSLLSGRTKEQLETCFSRLQNLPESPLWAVGTHHGVVSQMDSLFTAAPSITMSLLDRFYQAAELVLGSIERPELTTEKMNWLLPKQHQKHSDGLRVGFAQSVALLSVYGKLLLGSRLGFDGEGKARRLVSSLLGNLTNRELETHNSFLALYAEAAPDTFLSLIERDLKSQAPQTTALMRPAGVPLFYCPPRIGLLRALECLAWTPAPETFSRVIAILGCLAKEEIHDNFIDTPIFSLTNIFRSWMPQTASSETDRVRAVKALLAKHPAVGWKICLSGCWQYWKDAGHFNARPYWREEGMHSGDPAVNWEPYVSFAEQMTQLALSQPTYSVEMLIDLLDLVRPAPEKDQVAICAHILKWAPKVSDHNALRQLRDALLTKLLAPRIRNYVEKDVPPGMLGNFRKLYDRLGKMIGPHEQTAWLFKSDYLMDSLDSKEIPLIPSDFKKRDELVRGLRMTALKSILESEGLPGIIGCALRGNAGCSIGMIVCELLSDKERQNLISLCLVHPDPENKLKDVIAGVLGSLSDTERATLVEGLSGKNSEENTLKLLFCSPYRRATWTVAKKLGLDFWDRYWKKVRAFWIPDPQENAESIRHLLDAGRPSTAFSVTYISMDQTDPVLLAEILFAALPPSDDPIAGDAMNRYYIPEAMKRIGQSNALTLEQKASLEFSYLEMLTAPGNKTGDGLIHLETYIAQHPEFYARMIERVSGKGTSGNDAAIRHAYHLLNTLSQIPGLDKEGIEQQESTLMAWISAARNECGNLGNLPLADYFIGCLLSKAPKGADDIWPCEVVRNVAENFASEKMGEGIHCGLFNSRGVFGRSLTEGGRQERALAARYKTWAEALAFTHPFVSRVLMSLVNDYKLIAEQEDLRAKERLFRSN